MRKSRKYFGQRNFIYEVSNKDGEIISNETEQEWKERVKNELFSLDFDTLAMIFHDRDILDEENNELKKLHCHFIINYKNPRSYDSVLISTKCQERNLERMRSEAAAYRYLTHTTDESIKERKVRYGVNELLIKTADSDDFLSGDDLEKFYRIKIAGTGRGAQAFDTKAIVSELSNKIMTGELRFMDVYEELKGRLPLEEATIQFRNNRESFRKDEIYYYEQKYSDMVKNGRDLKTVFIEGPGGVGKSRFAQDLAREINSQVGNFTEDIHYAPSQSSGRYDFVDSYANQPITIFNDLNSKSFSYEQWLSIFDIEQVAMISSRYRNKEWFSEYSIITKSTKVNDWVNELCSNELYKHETESDKKNALYQAKRRIALNIELSNDGVFIKKYNDKGELKVIKHFKCTIAEFRVKKKRNEIIKFIINELIRK